LMHDAEYGAALVDETHRGQLARISLSDLL
jgi:hypothetical protein